VSEARNKGGRPPKAETLIARAVAETLRRAGGMARRVRNFYDAGGMGRRMAAWNPTKSGPNTSLRGLQNIRNRARDVSQNDWSGQAGVQKWTTNLIGIGITPRFKRVASKARKQEITDLWNDFCAVADADGVLNMYGMQTLAVRSWLESGEVFIRRRDRLPSAGLPIPMQVQLLEAEMVPLLDTDTWPGMPVGNIMRSGIELDRRGQRIAYWVYKEHPSDRSLSNIGNNDLVRVAASQMRHVFEPLRPGQLRGVSMLAPVLVRLKNIGDYEDATLERQKLANLFVGFIARTTPPLPGDEDRDPLTGNPIDVEIDDESGAPIGAALAGLTPGLMQELEDGQKVDWSNPPEAGTTYSDYMRTSHLGTAAAAGLPYELFSGDIVNISDRTLRIVINEFRRHAEQRQWQVVIPMMCQPVIDWFVQAAVAVNLIEASEADDCRRVEHAPHGWEYIHPVQDATGKKLEVEAGFRSQSSVIAARGDDPDAVADEIAADDARQQKLKIGPYSKAVLDAAAAAKAVPAPVPPPAPAPKASTVEQAILARLDAVNSRMDNMQPPNAANPVADAVLALLARQEDDDSEERERLAAMMEPSNG